MGKKINTLQKQIEVSQILGLRRHQVALMVFVQMLSIVVEGVGISLVLPILQSVNTGNVDLSVLPGGFQVFAEWLQALVGELTIGTLMVFLVVSVLIRQICQLARQVYAAHIRVEMTKRARVRLFSAFLNAPIHIREERPIGVLLNDVSVETERAIQSIISSLNAGALVLNSFLFVYFAIALDPALSLMALGAMVFSGLVISNLLVVSRRLSVKVTDANRSVIQFMSERMRAHRLVALTMMQKPEIAAAQLLAEEQGRQLFTMQSLKALLFLSIEPLVLITALGLFYVSIQSFDIPFEVLILFFVILIRLLPLFRELLSLVHSVLSVKGSLDVTHSNLIELGRYRDGDVSAGKPHTFSSPILVKKSLKIENLSFKYGDQGVSVLDNVNVEFKPATVSVIVGPSGAGKSTLIDMLPRLREPSEGRVLVDGTDIRDLDMETWRRSIAFVSQAPQIIDVTVSEFLSYGNPNTSRDEIVKAAHQAAAYDFIMALPDGFESRLGESGDRLSGGERQRLDLARALVGGATILICDEPTSHLDPKNHRLFIELLHRLAEETRRVIITISHRMEFIDQVDQLVLMKNGSVLAVGAPEVIAGDQNWEAFRGAEDELGRANTQGV